MLFETFPFHSLLFVLCDTISGREEKVVASSTPYKDHVDPPEHKQGQLEEKVHMRPTRGAQNLSDKFQSVVMQSRCWEILEMSIIVNSLGIQTVC